MRDIASSVSTKPQDSGLAGTRSVPPAYDTVSAVRSLLGAATAAGADSEQLARDAQLPGWAFNAHGKMLPSRYSMRLYELAEHALSDPDFGLSLVEHHRVGDLDLFDYLFSTAATLREGLKVAGRYLHLITTCNRRQVEEETDRETTYSYRHAEPGGRGEELCLQFNVAVLYARARAATGKNITPVRVAFAQSPPRSHKRLIEVLGMRNIDFGAPATTFTFSSRDLDLPMRGADPVLARILNRYAASLPLPPPVTWTEYFRQVLAQELEAGRPSLTAIADRMALSPRTLQRYLAERGTTWRAELDAARRRVAAQAQRNGKVGAASLTRLLGYSDPRAASRYLRHLDQS